MNAIIQALYHTPTLHSEVSLFNCSKNAQSVFESLKEVFSSLNDNKQKIFRPDRFYQIANPSFFKRGDQQDCSEFLTYLLDTIQQDEVNSCPSTSENIVRRVFGGIRRVFTECTVCYTRSERDELFTDIQLPVIAFQQNQMEIKDLVASSFKPEILEGDNQWDCPKCSRKTVSERRDRILSSPECLILTLKRFSHDSRSNTVKKILTSIRYSRYFNLPLLSEGHTQTYELYCVVIHRGATPNSGHYYTWIRYLLSYISNC